MAITKNGALPAAAGVGDVTLTGTQTLTNKTLTSPVVSGLTLSDGSLVLEGATANDFETTIQVTDPTADRTITIPDATTTLVGTDTTNTLTNKTISGASNTLTVRLDQSDVTGTLVTTKGGTGLSTYTTGDVVYASASNTLAKLAIGTSGQTLTVSAGGIVEWTTPSAGTTANDQAFAFAVQVFA